MDRDDRADNGADGVEAEEWDSVEDDGVLDASDT